MVWLFFSTESLVKFSLQIMSSHCCSPKRRNHYYEGEKRHSPLLLLIESGVDVSILSARPRNGWRPITELANYEMDLNHRSLFENGTLLDLGSSYISGTSNQKDHSPMSYLVRQVSTRQTCSSSSSSGWLALNHILKQPMPEIVINVPTVLLLNIYFY